MDCTIEGIDCTVNEVEIINELDGIVMSVCDDGCGALNRAMLDGHCLNVLLCSGDRIYKFLAVVNKCKNNSLYYMQSCAQITLTSMENKQ